MRPPEHNAPYGLVHRLVLSRYLHTPPSANAGAPPALARPASAAGRRRGGPTRRGAVLDRRRAGDADLGPRARNLGVYRLVGWLGVGRRVHAQRDRLAYGRARQARLLRRPGRPCALRAPRGRDRAPGDGPGEPGRDCPRLAGDDLRARPAHLHPGQVPARERPRDRDLDQPAGRARSDRGRARPRLRRALTRPAGRPVPTLQQSAARSRWDAAPAEPDSEAGREEPYDEAEERAAEHVERVVHTDVDAREADRDCEHVERHGETREREREHGRAGEARRGVAGRERMVVRHGHERLGLGVADGRPLDVDDALDRAREQVGDPVRGEHGEHQRRPAAEQRQHERDPDPDEPERADPREPDEDVVEDLGPVVDDKALEVAVEPGQTGAICFAWSISCWRSKGLPRKPRAPRATASDTARSSTVPLNTSTGIAPTPKRSWTWRSISQPSTSGIITSRSSSSGASFSSDARPSAALPASRTA